MKPLETVYWLRFGLGILAALLCVGFLIIAGAIHTNLVPNSSVETGYPPGTAPQDWISSGNGTEWNATSARTGSRSLRIEVNNSSAEWNVTVARIDGGNTYHIDGYFFGHVTGGQFLLTTNWFSDPGVPLSENDLNLTGNYSQWQVQAVDFTSPVGAKSCKIEFKAIQGSGDLYGDDFEVRQTEPNTSFFNSASIAVLVYVGSYYVIKLKFSTKVAKPQKILTAGIGIYLLTWIVFWALLYTIAAGL
jgi:hypothetical protein